jgi:hypothetical protein
LHRSQAEGECHRHLIVEVKCIADDPVEFRSNAVVKCRIIEAVFLMCVAPIVGCTPRVEPPPRPSSVSQSAIWAGGADGGAFIDCRVNADGSDSCAVYNDFTGQIWMRDRVYVLKGQSRGATRDELVYSGADGERIFLSNGDYLIPRH